MMHKTYVTFGQEHKHILNGQIFDRNCVAVISCLSAQEGRAKAFKYFGPKFCFEYHESDWDEKKLMYFPRGYVYVDDDYFKDSVENFQESSPNQSDEITKV